MKAEAQPCNSAWLGVSRRHLLTVGEIREALKDMPDDALLKRAEGGYLEAPENSAWGEVELKKRLCGLGQYVETCWE